MTQDEYLQAILSVIDENFRPNDTTGSMTAAVIGTLVRRVVAEAPSAFGFPRFKDALVELDRQGYIRVGQNSKAALAVWPLPREKQQSGIVAVAEPIVCATGASPAFRHRPLRNPVWFAFVSETPVGRRFIHKQTGEVKLGQTDLPEPPNAWAEIEPLRTDVQRDEARAFLQEVCQNEPSLESAIQSPRWFGEFPLALKEIDPELERKWKRRRSTWVITHVEKWCIDHQCPEPLVFEPPNTTSKRATSHVTAAQDGELKIYLLSALRRMSSAELMELPIPPKYIISVLRPDLLAD